MVNIPLMEASLANHWPEVRPKTTTTSTRLLRAPEVPWTISANRAVFLNPMSMSEEHDLSRLRNFSNDTNKGPMKPSFGKDRTSAQSSERGEIRQLEIPGNPYPMLALKLTAKVPLSG
jgi:hypothetical protein